MGSIRRGFYGLHLLGFVDKAESEYNELLDQVTFTAYTADRGNHIAGEYLNSVGPSMTISMESAPTDS